MGQDVSLDSFRLVLGRFLGSVPVETVAAQNRPERDLRGLPCGQSGVGDGDGGFAGQGGKDRAAGFLQYFLLVSAGLPIPTARTRVSLAPGARIVQVFPLPPMNSATGNALAIAPPVVSSSWAHSPEGFSPSWINSTSAPDLGSAGLAKATSSI